VVLGGRDVAGALDVAADELTGSGLVEGALASGERPDSLSALTGIDPWFLHQMQRITDFDRGLKGARWNDALVRRAKRLGFSDRHLAARMGLVESEVRRHRLAAGIRPVMKAVDTCGAEFKAERDKTAAQRK